MTQVKALTWNLSYGYGLGSEGTATYTQKEKMHFDSALELMGQFIREQNPDFIFLQEVDFDAKRSHHLAQLDLLARVSGLLYRSAIISWDQPYVPYPGLNPADHFGKTVSGGGILSRTELTQLKSILFPKPAENSTLYNFFYLSRYVQMVETTIRGEKIKIANTHLEAFSPVNRSEQWELLESALKDQNIDLLGGDFNGSIGLSESSRLTGVMAPTPTFPSREPTETLDGFILNPNRIHEPKLTTLNSGLVSDHFPVVLEFELH